MFNQANILPQNEREATMYIVVGFPGCGKTTFCMNKFIKPSIAKRRHVLVVLPHDNDKIWRNEKFITTDSPNWAKFEGLRCVIYEDDLIEKIFSDFKNGLILFDDCGSYVSSNIDIKLKAVIIGRRHISTELLVIGHGLSEIPPRFFRFTRFVTMFRTNDNLDARKKVLTDVKTWEKRQKHINNIAARTANPYYCETFDLLAVPGMKKQ